MQLNRLIQSLLRMRDPESGKKNLLIYLVIGVIVIAGLYYGKQQGAPSNGGPVTTLPEDGLDARCVRVVDGDTIEVVVEEGKKQRRETIRILGIDTSLVTVEYLVFTDL